MVNKLKVSAPTCAAHHSTAKVAPRPYLDVILQGALLLEHVVQLLHLLMQVLQHLLQVSDLTLHCALLRWHRRQRQLEAWLLSRRCRCRWICSCARCCTAGSTRACGCRCIRSDCSGLTSCSTGCGSTLRSCPVCVLLRCASLSRRSARLCSCVRWLRGLVSSLQVGDAGLAHLDGGLRASRASSVCAALVVRVKSPATVSLRVSIC